MSPRLPPGAELVTDQPFKLPPGAELVTDQPFAVGQSAPPEPSVGGFVSNLGTSAARFAGDVVAPITHPQETLAGVTGLLEGMAEKSGFKPVAGVSHAKNVDAFIDLYKNRYGSFDALKNTLYTDPVGAAADFAALASGVELGGKAVQVAGQAARLGRVADVAGTVAKAADVAASVTDPLRVAGTVTGAVAAPVAERTADFLRRSALKGGYATTAPAEEVRAAAQAMGENRIPFSEAGLAKVGQALEDLRNQVGKRVQSAAQAGATIDPADVMKRLDELEANYRKQVAPGKDVRDVLAVRKEFEANWPGPIPVEAAQEMKVGTGQQIGGKYGQASAAQIEAEKALARGLKEELEQQIPELAGLNAKQAKLIDLEGILGQAVNKYANSGGFKGGLAGQLLSREGALVGGAGIATGHSGAAAAMLTARALLANPKVKTALATAINFAQQNNPSRWGLPNAGTALSRVEEYTKSLAGEQQPGTAPAYPGILSPAEMEAARSRWK